jgi:hypothetical protein
MEPVYHIVAIHVNETSWAHVWRLRSRYLGMGYDTCLVVIFWSPCISLVERSHSSFALVVFCVQVRNCFLFSVMLMSVVSEKSRPRRVGLRTGILRLRAPMDDILF